MPLSLEGFAHDLGVLLLIIDDQDVGSSDFSVCHTGR
jgi:hypothetical protein